MKPDELRRNIQRQIPVTQHFGFQFESVTKDSVVAIAPLSQNDNHRGTAFGGSLFNMAILASYGWMFNWMNEHSPELSLLIASSEMKYLKEVSKDIRAVCLSPSADELTRIQQTLNKKGKFKLELQVQLYSKGSEELKAEFKGVFVGVEQRND